MVAVRSLEAIGFTEVADVLQVQDLQSMTGALSALESLSASRTVHSGRFYCKAYPPVKPRYPFLTAPK